MNITSYKKYLSFIITVSLLSVLMSLAIDMYLPAWNEIARQYKIHISKVQMSLNYYIFGFSIGQLLYGPLSDNFGRKPIILLGTVLFSIFSLFCAFANNIKIFIFIRFISGLSVSAVNVVIHALIRDIFKNNKFSKFISLISLITAVIPLISPILGGIILEFFGWNYIFFLISIISLIATILVIFFIQESLSLKDRKQFMLNNVFSNFLTILKKYNILFYIISMSCAFSGLFLFLNSAPYIYININKVAPKNFGYYLAVNILFLFIFSFINNYFVSYFGINKMFKLGMVIQFIASIFLLFIIIFNLKFNILVLALSIFISAIALIVPNGTAIILEDYSYISGTISALSGTFRFGLSAIFGSILSMFEINTFSLIVSMICCNLCAIIFYILALFFSKKIIFLEKKC